jgi:hypothetical protein
MKKIILQKYKDNNQVKVSMNDNIVTFLTFVKIKRSMLDDLYCKKCTYERRHCECNI